MTDRFVFHLVWLVLCYVSRSVALNFGFSLGIFKMTARPRVVRFGGRWSDGFRFVCFGICCCIDLRCLLSWFV